MKDAVHIIFLKYPIAGRVKTRLAKTLGDEKAVKIYRYLAENTIKSCNSSEYKTLLCVDENPERFTNWLGSGYSYIMQSEGGLGERLDNAFRWAFKNGYTKCAITGSDVAYLSSDEVSEAFKALKTTNTAIGKAVDGGYYLVAFSAHTYLADIFYNIEWSVDTVLAETLKKLENAGASYTILKELADIDTEDDLKYLDGVEID